MQRKEFPFYYGWAVVAVAFVTLAIGVNTRTTFSLLFPPILAEFGWDRGSTAAAFSCGFLAATVYAPIVGMLMDRWGPRVVIPLGAILVSAGMVSITLVSQPWHLYLTFGILVGGASTSISYLGHSLFLPYWFVRRRGTGPGACLFRRGRRFHPALPVGAKHHRSGLAGVRRVGSWRGSCWWSYFH